jgi:hypothetical protein
VRQTFAAFQSALRLGEGLDVQVPCVVLVFHARSVRESGHA